MWLNEGLGCDVERGFNYSKLCDSSSGCKSQEQWPKTLQDFYYNCYNCTIAIVPSSETSCRSTSSSSPALLGIMRVFLTGGVLLSFIFLVFTIHFRKNRIVKMSSPNLNVVTLLGSGLTYSSAYLFGLERQNPFTRPSMEMLVQIRICLLCIGMSLVFGPILGKSWRLYKVFTQQVPDKRVIIKDCQLLVMVAMLVLADVILLLIWIITDPVQCLQSFNTTLKVMETGLTCTVNQGNFCTSLYSDLWLILFLGFKGVLLMYGAYLAGLTDGVSCPPVNQSLTLIVGISMIFLSSGIMLVVNQFFHLWHNLVFGFASGGIFVCTATITCLIFIPQVWNQVRHWKAFEKEKDDISNMAKYFSSSSKNFHSTMYTDEEIYQLLGEKNSMVQLLAEKETAIASLQEQMNNAKEKLMRLVEVAGNYNAADSSVPYSSGLLQSCSGANCSSMVTSRDLFSSCQELNTGQYLKLSDAQCSLGSFSKKGSIDYLDCRSQQNVPLECTPLNERCETYVSNSHAKDQWLSQHTTTCNMGTQQHRLSTLNREAQQPEFSPTTQKEIPGNSFATNEKLQEILQELSLNHAILSPVSSRGLAQSPEDDQLMVWQPQEIQANTFTRFSPYKTRQKKKIPIHVAGYMVPDTWSIMNKTDGRLQRSCCELNEGPWTEASNTQDETPLHQPPGLTSLAFKKMLQYKAENFSEHSRNERHGWLLDKHQVEDCVSKLYSSRPRNLHPQWKDFLGPTKLGSLTSQHLYCESDSGSSSSGGVTCCHSLSSSTDSFSTDTDNGHSLDLDYCAKFYGKPRPIVNFIEDLKPIYV